MFLQRPKQDSGYGIISSAFAPLIAGGPDLPEEGWNIQHKMLPRSSGLGSAILGKKMVEPKDFLYKRGKKMINEPFCNN